MTDTSSGAISNEAMANEAISDEAMANETKVPAPIGDSSPWSAFLGDSRLVIGLAFIVIGLLWGAERAGLIEISATAVLAAATLIVGIALVVGSRHRELPNLIVVGFVFTLLTAATAAAPLEGFQGGIGEVTIEVAEAAELDEEYDLGIGSLTIDLSRLDGDGTVNDLVVNVGIGEATIIVPSDVDVVVRSRAGVGKVTLFGQTAEGIGVDQQYSSPEAGSARQLTIEANVFLGTVEVVDR